MHGASYSMVNRPLEHKLPTIPASSYPILIPFLPPPVKCSVLLKEHTRLLAANSNSETRNKRNSGWLSGFIDLNQPRVDKYINIWVASAIIFAYTAVASRIITDRMCVEYTKIY